MDSTTVNLGFFTQPVLSSGGIRTLGSSSASRRGATPTNFDCGAQLELVPWPTPTSTLLWDGMSGGVERKYPPARDRSTHGSITNSFLIKFP